MKCPRCQTENPAEARFCSNCGHSFVTSRSAYRSGNDLKEPQNETLVNDTHINSFNSSTISPAHIEGERRVVTILFCDLKGSTALAEHLDPEEWADIMNEVFKLLIEPVNRYGGTVARLLGDAILAFFGAPKAHEDDPQRAVLAGLEMVENIRQFNGSPQLGRELNIQVRVGINTGLVVVGEVDSGFRSEYTALGDAVNLAARMEQTAQVGTVQVSEETFRLISGHFDVESLGTLEVKGKSIPVPAYRVIGQKSIPMGGQGIREFRAPLVGRQGEMKRLREAASLVQLGRGQVVCLVGEAGIGKSRLIHEIKREWFSTLEPAPVKTPHSQHHDQDKSWRETRSISYATNLPYGTFHQLVRTLCNASINDPPDVLREKIACECLTDDAPEENCQKVSRAFEVLLGVINPSTQPELEGETFKRELFDAMTITWRDWASNTPTVLVFEDLHWADPASIELLIHLFKLVEEIPVLFLCAFRPERDAPTWLIKQVAEREYPHRYTEINLNPLSIPDSQTLVDRLLSYAQLPGPLRAMILSKSEGNPFFVEQIVQSMVEEGILTEEKADGNHVSTHKWRIVKEVNDITIPDTVHALLQARIDRLDDGTRQTLQKAAVIGRTFYSPVLKNISSAELNLEKQLAKLERAGLIQEVARFPEVEYVFSHALAQETAYKSILRKRRREYHLRVGEAIEKLYPDRLEEAAPLLAYHFYEARDRRALNYYVMAGEIASRLYANTEAVAHYSRAIEIARQYQAADLMSKIYTQRGRALELNAQYDLAQANYIEMEETARQLNDSSLLLAAYLARAALLSAPSSISDPMTARSLLDTALSMSRESGNRAAEARVLWNLSLVAARFGDPNEAANHGEHAITIAKELGIKELIAFTLHDLSWAYFPLGKLHRARQVLDESRQLWIELDNKPMLADNYATRSFLYLIEGNYQDALSASEQGLQISMEINNLWGQAFNRMYTGEIYYERGEPDKAIHTMEECLRLALEAGFWVPQTYTRVDLAVVYASLGKVEEARELYQEIQKQTNTLPFWEQSWLLSSLARVKAYTGELDQAQHMLPKIQESATNTFEQVFYISIWQEIADMRKDYNQVLSLVDQMMPMIDMGIRIFLPQTLYLQGKALLSLERFQEARQVLLRAVAEMEKIQARRMSWQTQATLAELEARLGNHEIAQKHHQEAVKVIYYIADRAGMAKPSSGSGEELRASFLNLPGVKSALAFHVSA